MDSVAHDENSAGLGDLSISIDMQDQIESDLTNRSEPSDASLPITTEKTDSSEPNTIDVAISDTPRPLGTVGTVLSTAMDYVVIPYLKFRF